MEPEAGRKMQVFKELEQTDVVCSPVEVAADSLLDRFLQSVQSLLGVTARTMNRLLRELVRIRERTIPNCGNRLDWTRATNGRPEFAGVYAFWWSGSPCSFLRAMGNRTLHFHGPAGAQLSWALTRENLAVASNGMIPLYVGKNASDIARRVGLHLKLKTPRTVAANAVGGICRRMTTSCQVRDRLDRLFPQFSDTRPLVLRNLALSYVRLDGKQGFVRRFFLEDLAIGSLRPMFNVDSER